MKNLTAKTRQDEQDVSGLTGFCSMQNLNTTAMDGRSRTSLCFATPGLLPNGGSVENVGTIFNHYIHVDNRILYCDSSSRIILLSCQLA